MNLFPLLQSQYSIENMSAQTAPTIVIVNETIETPNTASAKTTAVYASIETPNLAYAQPTTVTASTIDQDPSTVHDNRSKITEPDLVLIGLGFGSLISTQGEEDLRQ
ncbi:unnamed protein product [Microthlaspi erraticum]|uniref:Uncharacterized protein n=1 Tax=Microthlaspi erraticum TaxID=1685480 RepID=A0A6D2I607_9BRAS|nr:unnamed protein product [Microthlaspi erraticum]